VPDNLGNILVSSILVERYITATQLAETGQIAEALAAYQEIFQGESGESLKGFVTGEFLALVELQKARCSQILGDHQSANAIFEEMDRYLAGQLDMADLYQFYLSYGDSLGSLGLIKDMEDRMAHAMNIALEELNDIARFRAVWDQTLYWEKEHELWSLLAEHSESTHQFGVQYQDIAMQLKAITYHCYAQRGLGNYEVAKQAAEGMLRLYRELEGNSIVVKEWEDFLASLPRF
jgi:tetratricopeptide (TPR) repeat protein